MNKRNLSGLHSGRLLFIRPTEERERGSIVWECRCSCGKELKVAASKFGRKHSCGCYTHEVLSELAKNRKARIKHGMRRTRPYYVWTTMKDRCFNKNSKGYKNYGGRGITVYDGWIHDFQAFYNYISSLPHFGETGYSIDRIDNDGNYEPGNIRYADRKTQNNNRRNVRNKQKT